MPDKIKSLYYARVAFLKSVEFENYTKKEGIVPLLLSTDTVDSIASNLYQLEITGEDALALKLSVPLMGLLRFRKS